MDFAAVKLLLETIQQRNQEQQERFLEQQQQLILLLQQSNTIKTEGGDAFRIFHPSSKAESIRNLKELLDKFEHDPENNGTFEKWYERYESIFTSTDELTEDDKRILILQCLQQSDYNFYRDSIRPAKPHEVPFEKTVEELKRLFGFCETKFSLRTKCFNLTIDDVEDYAKYAARINYCAERFDVGSCSPDDLKVLLFLKGLRGTKHERILEKLLMMVDQNSAAFEILKTQEERNAFRKHNLQDVVNAAERMVSIQDDKKAVCSPSDIASFNVVHSKNKKNPDTHSSKSTANTASSTKSSGVHQKSFEPGKRAKLPRTPCWKCGGPHWLDECPHKLAKCPNCNEIGHLPEYCAMSHLKLTPGRTIRRRRSDPGQPSTNHIANNTTNAKNRKFVEANINGASIKLQLDTGSDITIISNANWRLLGKPSLHSIDKEIASASGDPVELKGKFPCVMKLQGLEEYGEVHVSPHNLNLFGADWIRAFKLWDVAPTAYCHTVKLTKEDHSDFITEIKNKFPKVFSDGLGCCTKTTATMTLKDGALPTYRKARPVPHAALQAVTAELERLQHLGVITPTTHSEYAAPIVVIKKKTGMLRICGDYSTGLNDSLEPDHHPLPTPDQIFTHLAGCTKFSKIDLTDAFWQISVDENARKMLTINTHLGLFNVNRLQQGVKTAPAIFQKIVDSMCSGINSCPFIDDIICGGTDDTHDKELYKTLQRIDEYGLKVRIDKCEFGKQEIEFCGHIVDKNGIRPHPDKLVAIQDLPIPTDVHQLRSFLGAVNYYGKFIHKMKELRAPLDKLLEKNEQFKWTSEQRQAFDNIKKVLSSDLVLTHFDCKKKIVLATDASQHGMGAVLMHEFNDGSLHPIMHWSSTFNSAEKNYPQIQKEARALVFGLKKAHFYIFGRRIEIHIDHKPLLAIFGSKKGVPVYTASRLARYALIVMAYDFSIKYVNTDSFGYADVVSRLIAEHPIPEEDVVIANIQATNEDESVVDTIQEDDPIICSTVNSSNIEPLTFREVQTATRQCPILQQVKAYINKDKWPAKQRQITNKSAAEFFNVRRYLHTNQDCIFFNDRLIIPMKLQQKVLQELHEGHPGISRMKLLAQNFVYWPHIDEHVEKFIRTCENCAITSKAPTKCTLQPWPVPKSRWSRLHIDYAGPIEGNYFLIIVDAYSKWPEIYKTSSITSNRTVELLSDALAQHGDCDTIVSDNGRQFDCSTFNEFCRSRGITHITTAPYSPMSNGQAERFVDTFKRGIKKLSGNIDQKLREFLVSYRRTPSYNLGGKSPAELLNNYPMKSRLDLLKPTENAHTSFNQRNDRMKFQFDRHHGAKFREFAIGDEVYYQKHVTTEKWQWTPAIIIERLGEVNYKIEIDSTSHEKRVIKAHASQMKFRFTQNELMDTFDLDSDFTAAPTGQIEPIVIPHQLPENLDDNFHDALIEQMATPQQLPENPNDSNQSFDDSFHDAIDNDQTLISPPRDMEPRRSKRTKAGIPPERYHDVFQIKRGGM